MAIDPKESIDRSRCPREVTATARQLRDRNHGHRRTKRRHHGAADRRGRRSRRLRGAALVHHRQTQPQGAGDQRRCGDVSDLRRPRQGRVSPPDGTGTRRRGPRASRGALYAGPADVVSRRSRRSADDAGAVRRDQGEFWDQHNGMLRLLAAFTKAIVTGSPGSSGNTGTATAVTARTGQRARDTMCSDRLDASSRGHVAARVLRHVLDAGDQAIDLLPACCRCAWPRGTAFRFPVVIVRM